MTFHIELTRAGQEERRKHKIEHKPIEGGHTSHKYLERQDESQRWGGGVNLFTSRFVELGPMHSKNAPVHLPNLQSQCWATVIPKTSSPS